jgi:hypothetical protein
MRGAPQAATRLTTHFPLKRVSQTGPQPLLCTSAPPRAPSCPQPAPTLEAKRTASPPSPTPTPQPNPAPHPPTPPAPSPRALPHHRPPPPNTAPPTPTFPYRLAHPQTHPPNSPSVVRHDPHQRPIPLHQNDLPTAKSLLEQTLDARSRILGPDHPDTQTTRFFLLVTLQQMEDPAAKAHREALQPLLDADPDTLTADQRRIRDGLLALGPTQGERN